ncbi:MAG: hypothetical protein D4R64_02100 [Porphyromonadaceae bacterium]|nr:MAG: hypothetical protein D4R64_02100 [Porphyromonadaceae bacterium]
MKKLFVILIFALGIISCGKDKISLTCEGNCNNYSFRIGKESGSVTMNITSHYSYDSNGNVSSVSSSGTLTFQNSGNTYHVDQVVNYSTCKYTVTVNGEYSCGN